MDPGVWGEVTTLAGPAAIIVMRDCGGHADVVTMANSPSMGDSGHDEFKRLASGLLHECPSGTEPGGGFVRTGSIHAAGG